MKASEFRALSTEEVVRKVADLKEELFNLRFQHSTGQLENPRKLLQVKKDIARAKTILKESQRKTQQDKE
jgi:large subunit ribosomal protein L29